MNICYAIYADKTVFVEISNNIKKMLKFRQKINILNIQNIYEQFN
jgi:hypothetical protein